LQQVSGDGLTFTVFVFFLFPAPQSGAGEKREIEPFCPGCVVHAGVHGRRNLRETLTQC
jgi:hypothetical protein